MKDRQEKHTFLEIGVEADVVSVLFFLTVVDSVGDTSMGFVVNLIDLVDLALVVFFFGESPSKECKRLLR